MQDEEDEKIKQELAPLVDKAWIIPQRHQTPFSPAR